MAVVHGPSAKTIPGNSAVVSPNRPGLPGAVTRPSRFPS
jgi:hypothetical protein